MTSTPPAADPPPPDRRPPAPTTLERRGKRELVVTRRFAAPIALVFRAWSEADLFRRWWVPVSVPGIRLVGCELDVRTGGSYRLEFAAEGQEGTMAFHGRYLEVIPDRRIVWTNEEGEDGAVTTVTFTSEGTGTRVSYSERFRDPEAMEEALRGSAAALPEQLDQLEALLGRIS